MLMTIKRVLGFGGGAKDQNEHAIVARSISFMSRFGLGGDEPTTGAQCVVLSSRTPLLTAAAVGGKAHNLIKLFRMNVPIPETCVLTCSAYDNGRTTSNLEPEVITILERFLDPKARYAVRSSANCEDGADSAYAGQFLTTLNVPGDIRAIVKAVRRCWESLNAPAVADKLPASAKMGVVVMRQVDSRKAGVLFQANPITNSRATHVITACYGQGEGTVGGRLAVDTYSFKEATLEIRYKNTPTKTHMIILAEEEDTKEVDVPPALQNVACLTDAEIVLVAKVGKAIRVHCHSPQDIEFCFDAAGKLYILQTRPITTLAETLEWKAPEPGLWQLNGHLPTPMSEFYGPCWMYGHRKGAYDCTYIAGTGIARVDTATVNGFAYFCMRNPGPKAAPKSLPPPFLLRNIIRLTGRHAIKVAQEFWTKKMWRVFMEHEYPKRKAAWKKEMDEWKAKLWGIRALDDAQLASLVQEAQDLGCRMYHEHATVTIYNLMPVAHFMRMLMDATGCTAVEAFSCIDGFSPISQGICGEFPDQTKLLCEDEALVEEISHPKLTQDSQAAMDKWMALTERENKTPSVAALCEVLETIKYRLADGYDSANDTMLEAPALVFTALQDAVKKFRNGNIAKIQRRADESSRALFAKVNDPVKLAELEEFLVEARLLAPLRDERAILTDLTACGIIHHILLEVGSRLTARDANGAEAVRQSSRLALYAKLEEVTEWLRDKKEAPPASFWDELKRRKLYRETASVMDAPPLLGGDMLIPSAEHFPDPYMARSVLLVIFVIDQIFAAPDLELTATGDKALQNDKDTIVGFSGSPGKTQGTARVVNDAKDATELLPGEICVTKYPSSLINVLLGKAGGIVTDLGGVLCHAAICAREAHLPCVIGCHTATSRIKTGDVIELDGTTGVIKILKRQAQ